MGYGIRLQVWGDRACYTRPEMKAERVSYDVMTPSAARGILECIHWKPSMRWVVERIHVLREPRFDTFRRNEVGSLMAGGTVRSAMRQGAPGSLRQVITADRQQRATLLLRDVAYVIEAHFEMTGKRGPDDTPEKHYNIVLRRARAGQAFRTPCLGCREFAAHFALLEKEEPLPASELQGERDLGWMLQDIDYAHGNTPLFFRAVLRDGVLEVPRLGKKEAGA